MVVCVCDCNGVALGCGFLGMGVGSPFLFSLHSLIFLLCVTVLKILRLCRMVSFLLFGVVFFFTLVLVLKSILFLAFI